MELTCMICGKKESVPEKVSAVRLDNHYGWGEYASGYEHNNCHNRQRVEKQRAELNDFTFPLMSELRPKLVENARWEEAEADVTDDAMFARHVGQMVDAIQHGGRGDYTIKVERVTPWISQQLNSMAAVGYVVERKKDPNAEGPAAIIKVAP